MTRTLQLLNWLGFIAVIVTNTLANTLPINNLTTGEVAALYPNYFVPAGFTFSIWALIYLALFAFIIWQSGGLYTGEKKPIAVKLIGLWFFFSCLANAAWIVFWHHLQPLWSLLLMVFLLFTLIQIYRNLGYGKRQLSRLEKICVHLPFSLYLVWISVATIANVTAVLVHYNFEGLGLPPEFWSAAMIIVAGLLALFFLNLNFDFIYALVVVWACIGILAKFYFQNSDSPPVISTSAAAVIALILYRITRSARSFKGNKAYF